MATKKDEKVLDQIVRHHAMIEHGIVPYDGTDVGAYRTHDANKALECLSEEERRSAKRKFRKLWRKLLRRHKADKKFREALYEGPLHASFMDSTVGKGLKAPLPQHKVARKRLVLRAVNKFIVEPAVENFNKVLGERPDDPNGEGNKDAQDT